MSDITEADWLEGRDNWREAYGRDLEDEEDTLSE